MVSYKFIWVVKAFKDNEVDHFASCVGEFRIPAGPVMTYYVFTPYPKHCKAGHCICQIRGSSAHKKRVVHVNHSLATYQLIYRIRTEN